MPFERPFRPWRAAAALLLSLPVLLRAGEQVFPDDVFQPYAFVDVTKPPYNADSTGKEDVTEKLRQAIVDIYHEGQPALRIKTLYFPNGTYRITDTLDAVAIKKDGKQGIVHRLRWFGQSRDGTVIKLDDGLPAFQDPAKPKGMIKTESIGNNGNDAYDNCFASLTLDAGAGNPGAAAIDWLANNNGFIRDVRLRAAPGSGYAGLLMARAWPGPAYVKGLEVAGFDYGVRLTHMEYSVTFEHLVLRDQRRAAFRNEDNAAFIRDLRSENAVPAVENPSRGGLVVLTDSQLKGGAADAPAIANGGGLFLRNVETSGYGEGVRATAKDGGLAAPAGPIAEFSSHPPLVNKGFPNARTTSLGLEVREAPDFEDNDFKTWYSVGAKAKPYDQAVDQSAAIQAAIDEAAAQGKTTLYFPPGQYVVAKTLELHGSLRRVLGLGTVLRAKGGADFADAANPKPIFHVHDIAGDSLEISQVLLAPSLDHPMGFYGVRHDSPKTLVLRDYEIGGMGLPGPLAGYQPGDNAGDVYLENVGGNSWVFRPGQRVWARQLDPEGKISPKVVNAGAKLWILGLKTEKPGTIVDTSRGGETEVLGGLFYPVIAPTDDPMFRVEDGRLSASYVTVDNSANPDSPNQVQEIRGGVSQTLHREDTYPRPCFGNGIAALVPLVVAAPAEATPHQP